MNNLRQIIASIELLKADDRPAIVATVVEVSGSSYRRPGARLVLMPDNQRYGMISGGCLERDLALRAWSLTEHGPCVVAYDTRGRLEQPAGDFGAGCDGVVHVFLQRIDPHDDALLQTMKAVVTCRRTARLATVFRIQDPVGTAASVSVGDQIGVDASKDSSVRSPPGVSCNPARDESILTAIEDRLASSSWPARTFGLRLHLDADPAVSVDVLMEQIEPVPRLVIFGAGDDAVPLAALAQGTGWDTLVWDRRPTQLTPARFFGPTLSERPEDAIQQMGLTSGDYAVLMTHDLDDDATLLNQLVKSPVSYIGLLGPKRRAAKLMTELHLRNQLPDPTQLENIRTPIGLDIGAEGAEEIAISILAEVIAHRNTRSGTSLHLRDRSIHDASPTEIQRINISTPQTI